LRIITEVGAWITDEDITVNMNNLNNIEMHNIFSDNK
jgi:hypothetical protein